jgi:hypothetical protein
MPFDATVRPDPAQHDAALAVQERRDGLHCYANLDSMLPVAPRRVSSVAQNFEWYGVNMRGPVTSPTLAETMRACQFRVWISHGLNL